MKTLLTAFRALLVLINTAGQIFFLSIERLFRSDKIATGYKHRKMWAKNSCRILGIHLDEVSGSIDVPVALIISNHRTLLDPLIQVAHFNAHIIAKQSVSKLPIIAQGARMTGIFFVKREKLSSRAAAKKTTFELLEQNINVLVYAEGTTGTNQGTIAFKKGTFAVAAELGVPVVPVAIEYPEEKDMWIDISLGQQMVRQIGALKTRAKLRIGPPIYSDDTISLMNQSKSWIDHNLNEMQEGWSQVFTSSQLSDVSEK